MKNTKANQKKAVDAVFRDGIKSCYFDTLGDAAETFEIIGASMNANEELFDGSISNDLDWEQLNIADVREEMLSYASSKYRVHGRGAK